jgi:hypothetical protein
MTLCIYAIKNVCRRCELSALYGAREYISQLYVCFVVCDAAVEF